jgi:hypothetical protein
MGAVWLMRRLMTLGGLVMLAGCAPLAVSGSSQDVFTGSVPVEAQQPPNALQSTGDVPSEVILACHQFMTAQAQSLGATWLEAASAGTLVRLPDGATDAPLEVRVTYQHKDRVDVRQARITCRLNDQGEVTDLLEPDGSEAQRTPS